MLTITGAIIVFIVFIVKDNLRDDLKDVVSSVENANNYYNTQDNLDAIRRQLVSLDEQVTVGHKHRPTCEPLTDSDLTPGNLGSLVSELKIEQLNMNRSLDILQDLDTKLGNERDSSIFDVVRKHLNEPNLSVRQDPQSVILSDLAICGSSTNTIRLKALVLKDAKQQMADDAAAYRLAERLSVMFFTIGWLITFLGALGGIDEPGAA